MAFSHPQKGLTVVEAVVTVAVLGVSVLLTRFGLNFIHTLYFQGSRIQLQQDAQVVLYNMAKDIRNASEIIDVKPDKLVLRSFNIPQFGYASPQTFLRVNTGTTTYQYKEIATSRFLERTSDFPGNSIGQIAYLKNTLLTPDATNYLFKGGPNPVPPFETVELVLRLVPSLRKESVLIFREEIMKRAQTN